MYYTAEYNLSTRVCRLFGYCCAGGGEGLGKRDGGSGMEAHEYGGGGGGGGDDDDDDVVERVFGGGEGIVRVTRAGRRAERGPA